MDFNSTNHERRLLAESSQSSDLARLDGLIVSSRPITAVHILWVRR